MRFHVLTLFPETVSGALSDSIIGRARQQGKIELNTVDIRDFTRDKHRRVDDYTYGGGAGMLMQAQPVYDAYAHVCGQIPPEGKKRVVYVTPQGIPFTQTMVQELAAADDLVILCGHYEGVDERVLEEIATDYVSIGDYVLTGGELAAMVIIDAVARLVPGVLHNEESARTESFSGELLEYPQYSRPEVWHGKEVPAVLLSGNRREIDKWRLEQSLLRTKERRPDLYQKYLRLEQCKERMAEQKLLHIDMIELINRGRAVLVFEKEGEILLRDRMTGIYYYTDMRPDEIRSGQSPVFESWLKQNPQHCTCLVLHREETVSLLKEQFGYEQTAACYNCAYTNREKHSVSGLYRPDGKAMDNGLVIRPVGLEQEPVILSGYRGVEKPQQVRKQLAAGQMIGAFFGDELAGFAGYYEDGSIGLFTVLPEYRRRRVGTALLVCLLNQSIEQGQIPYGQVMTGNVAGRALVKKAGMYEAKMPVYWVEK